MLALFLFILFGVIFGYFATLNTTPITISFGTSLLENIPLYLVIFLTLAIGVFVTSLFYYLKSFSRKRQDREITELKKENTDLLKHNHKLELENTRFRAEIGEEAEDEHSL